MTSCMAVKENICAYLDNELNPEDRRRFEEHIESCTACRREFDEMSEIIGLCTSLPQQELPDGFGAELHEKLLVAADRQRNNITGIDKSKRASYIKMFSSIAAGLLLIFLTGSLIKYGFFQSGNMAQIGQSAENSEMQAPVQPSAKAQYDGTADNGADAGAPVENTVSVEAADAIQGIMSFSKSAAPNGTVADRSVSASGRSGALAYANSQQADETVSNKVSTITITADEPEAVTKKVKTLALENNGELKEQTLSKASAKSTSGGQSAEAGAGDAQPLYYVIPNANYDKFVSSVNGTFGAANVQSGALVTEDLTGTLNDKMKRSDEIDSQIQVLQQNSAKNADTINELKTEKEELEGQIETIRLDSDFVTVTIYINKK